MAVSPSHGHRVLHRRGVGELGADVPEHRPVDRRHPRRRGAGGGQGDRPGRGGGPPRQPGVAGHHPRAALRAAVGAGRPDRRRGRDARPAGERGQRQAAVAGAQRRAGVRALLPLLQPRHRVVLRPEHPAAAGPARLHPPRAARRHRPHRRLELPDAAVRPGGGAGHRRRELRGAQAGRRDAAHGGLPRPAGRRGGPAAWRGQRGHRARAGGRRRPRRPPGRRPPQLRRLHRGRPPDRGRGRPAGGAGDA